MLKCVMYDTCLGFLSSASVPESGQASLKPDAADPGSQRGDQEQPLAHHRRVQCHLSSLSFYPQPHGTPIISTCLFTGQGSIVFLMSETWGVYARMHMCVQTHSSPERWHHLYMKNPLDATVEQHCIFN